MSALDRVIRYGKDGELWVREGALGDRWVDTPNPLLEQTRMYWGRGLNPEDIEGVIQRADCGFMRDLSDLTAEATRVDGHFSMCDSKRVRAASAIKPQVVPATGIGIDPKIAELYADVVRQNLAWIPAQRQVLRRLAYGLKHGRSAAEKVWKENPAASKQPGGISDPRSVRWRIDRVNWIHARRLAFGPERELRVRDDLWGGYGFEARGLSLKDYPYKFIAFTPQRFDEYPEREGYGVRGLYFAFFKRFGTREELILLEQYGRPRRTIGIDPDYNGGAGVQKEQLDQAAKAIDETSANATGVRPPGTTIDTDQPVTGAGQVHQNVKHDANDELSKLILGEVRTSDAKPGALGSGAEEVALDVQDDVKSDDATDLSDLFTEQFAVDVIALNFGTDKLDHCPRIELLYERPPTRDQRIDRTKKVWEMGIGLKEDEVYEEVGFTKPAPGDVVIKQAPQPAGPFGAPPAAGAEEGTTPGATGPDASPLGTGGEGTKSPDDQQTMSARPPDFTPWARAAHVLELASYAAQGERVIRYQLPKAPLKTEP